MSDSNTIAELMARDPLQCTDRDIEEIIAHYRKERSTLLVTTRKTSGNKAKAKKLIAAESAAKSVGVDLGDIDLGI